jgi:single-strand DNA-binding protein
VASVNRVILIGHLGKDRQVRQTQGGKKVANFSLATKSRFSHEEATQD